MLCSELRDIVVLKKYKPSQDMVANAESIVSYSFQSWDISYQQPCTIDWEASKSKEIFIQYQR